MWRVDCARRAPYCLKRGQVVEYKVQYDGTGADPTTHCSIAKDVQPLSPPGFNCTISIHVKETMSPPVYVYYELDNFYQNHRRYVKSRSDAQLKGGNNFPNAATTDCDPLKKAANGKLLWPCGLIANSMFNGTWVGGDVVGCPRYWELHRMCCTPGPCADTIYLTSVTNTDGTTNDTTYTMNEKGIAWESDKYVALGWAGWAPAPPCRGGWANL